MRVPRHLSWDSVLHPLSGSSSFLIGSSNPAVSVSCPTCWTTRRNYYASLSSPLIFHPFNNKLLLQAIRLSLTQCSVVLWSLAKEMCNLNANDDIWSPIHLALSWEVDDLCQEIENLHTLIRAANFPITDCVSATSKRLPRFYDDSLFMTMPAAKSPSWRKWKVQSSQSEYILYRSTQ